MLLYVDLHVDAVRTYHYTVLLISAACVDIFTNYITKLSYFYAFIVNQLDFSEYSGFSTLQ